MAGSALVGTGDAILPAISQLWRRARRRHACTGGSRQEATLARTDGGHSIMDGCAASPAGGDPNKQCSTRAARPHTPSSITRQTHKSPSPTHPSWRTTHRLYPPTPPLCCYRANTLAALAAPYMMYARTSTLSVQCECRLHWHESRAVTTPCHPSLQMHAHTYACANQHLQLLCAPACVLSRTLVLLISTAARPLRHEASARPRPTGSRERDRCTREKQKQKGGGGGGGGQLVHQPRPWRHSELQRIAERRS